METEQLNNYGHEYDPDEEAQPETYDGVEEEPQYDHEHQLDETPQYMNSSNPGGGGGSSSFYNPHVRMSVDDTAIGSYRDSPEGYPSLRRVSSGSHLNTRSYDDSFYQNNSYGDMRMQKIAQTEAAIRQDMFKECTFRPKIKGLPPSYGPLKEHGTPFVARMMKWQEQKFTDIENKMKTTLKNTAEQCPFKPKINKNSEIVAKENIRTSPGETANERLYRGYNEINAHRQQFLEKELRLEEEEMRRQCTFQPQLVTKGKPQFEYVQSKYEHVPLSSSQKPVAEPKVSKDCTFTPKVKGVKPNMLSAKIYVSANVVDRLTRPILTDKDSTIAASSLDDSMLRTFDNSFDQTMNTPAANNPNMVIDAATFLQNVGSSNRSVDGSHHGGHHTPSGMRRSASFTSITRKSAEQLQQEELAKQQKKELNARRTQEFNRFLERQQIVLKKREENKQKMERCLTPDFKPRVGRQQTPTNTHSNRADFLTRQERDLQRRLSSEQRAQEEIPTNEQQHCTFHPKTSKLSEKLRPKSVHELSTGDMLKQETKLKMLKLQYEQEQLAKATFTPQFVAKPKETVKAKLSITQDTQSYLEWIQTKKQQQEEQRAKELLKRQEDELEGCTFKPQTTECPAYIRRIAESISKMKTARSSFGGHKSHEKPDWR